MSSVLFFPEVGGAASFSVNVAQRVCRSCPVRCDCLDDALARGERYGIWGGYTTDQRRRIRYQRRRAARVNVSAGRYRDATIGQPRRSDVGIGSMTPDHDIVVHREE
jgi:WhiB family redox-sensing transcriptional regulator